jgi:nucleotidyltransferase substrate binding protein (TIGR01987 family)
VPGAGCRVPNPKRSPLSKSPRGTIKKAFEMGIIENGHDWMDLLLDRNLTAHTYDEQKATEMEQLI